MSVYDTLYDWQKLFVDRTPQEWFEEVYGRERILEVMGQGHVRSERLKNFVGLFLRMGVGKTKIAVARAEKAGADLILATSLRSKVTAGMIGGEFGDELTLAGYEVFFAHKAYSAEHELVVPAVSGKREHARLVEAVRAGKKVAYVFNHEHVGTEKGYQLLTYLVSQYKNVHWIIDEAHKISNHKSGVGARVYEMLYSYGTPGVKVNLRELNKAKKAATGAELEELLRVEQLTKSNVFRENIKGLILATGTPNASGYVSFYHLMRLLGHNWSTLADVEVKHEDENGMVTKSIEQKVLNDYKAFFYDYCVEDLYAKKFNPYGQSIKSYKNVDGLLTLVQQFAFFAKTDNYFKGMPARLTEVMWIPKHESYDMLTDSKLDNPYYRVLDGFICDTPALLGMRARQIASGFMGNAEESKYYHTHKVDALEDYFNEHEDNYIVFYNYTPELYMIMSACEGAGYKYEVYNGDQKSLENYYKMAGKADEKNVLIANIASGSAALNLQKFNKVIFFAPPIMFKDFDQAIGRVERLGQKAREISVLMMLMSKTREAKVWANLLEGKDYTDVMWEKDFVWKKM